MLSSHVHADFAAVTRASQVPERFRYTDGYYEALGDPKGTVGILDRLRFHVVAQEVVGDSVLDIGAYHGDFLSLMRHRGLEEMHGTEVNPVRMRLANGRIGARVVRIGFRHGELSDFRDDSVDTVVCMEVLEHVDDLKTAVDEILRVARRRVIITVPCSQKLSYELCIHCNRYTPVSGHLRAFHRDSLQRLFAGRLRAIRTRAIGHLGLMRSVRRLASVMPLSALAGLDWVACTMARTGRWRLVVGDK